MDSDSSESPCPLGFLGGREHFADVSGGCREQLRLLCCRLELNNVQSEFPCNSMLHHVAELDIHWPHPF